MEANEALLSKALKIGCTVTICYKDEEGNNYYACCEGFTSMKLRLLRASQIREQGRLSQCLFKLVPPFQYTQFNKGKDAFKQKDSLKETTNIDQRDSRLEFPKQIKQMQDESTLNQESLEKLKGQAIFYGQTIQFIHQASNKYLCYNSAQVSDYESDSWKATLNRDHGEDTQFKFLSSFSFQQETGGYIFDEDTVYIVSVIDLNTEPGLHASSKKKGRDKRELNVAPEKRSFWKINIFSKYIDDELNQLSVFDVVWINYSETNLNLIVQKYSPQGDKKYLKFEKGEENEQINQFVGDSNGMYVVENIDPEKGDFLNGGYVEWIKEYRLKHLTTNHYLKLEPFQDMFGADVSQFRLIAVNTVTQASNFKFEMIYSTINGKDNIEFMCKDSYFRLSVRINQQDQWLKIDTTIPNEIYKIEGDNFIEDITIPLFSNEKKDEHVFNLAYASINDVRLIQYLLSCMKTLKRSQEYLDVDLNNTENFKHPDFQSVYKKLGVRSQALEKCLTDLYLLCYNKLEGYVSFDSEFGVPHQRTQNLLKEQYFFEILVQILIYCFPTQESLEEASQPIQLANVTTVLSFKEQNDENLEKQIKARFVERKKVICTKIFNLLTAMVIDNLANQEYCSKYLPIFSVQSLYLNGAIDTIVQIIRNFEELLLNLNKDVNDLDLHPQMSQKVNSARATPLAQSKHKKKLKEETKKPSIDYNQQYKAISLQIKNNNHSRIQRWDLLMFFTTMLKRKDFMFNKKIEIMQFLKEASCLEGRGINVNQESAYKYILSSQTVFEDETLIRLKSDGPQLKVYRGGDEQTLLDYYHRHNQHDQNLDPYFIPYVQELMLMYSKMCNSRNYTWKKFAENFFNVESLIENIQNNQYNVQIRSIICNLLNKLYVDQEPRRIIVWPELCKIVRTERKGQKKDLNNTMLSEGKYNKQNEKQTKTDPVDIPKVQEKILGYLFEMYKIVQANSDLVDLGKGPNERKDMLKTVFTNAPFIYNELTLEVIRLFRLLIQFGKYAIRIGENEEETINLNRELFQNIRSMTAILEYNSTYPEVRKILCEKRQEEKAKNEKLNLNIFGLGDKKKEVQQQVIKQQYSGEDDAQDLSEAEGFQKQVEFLSLKMNEFMYKQQLITDPLIKLEICEILDQYLDSKMDFYLNNLKIQFSEWVEKLDLFNKVFNRDLDIDNDEHRNSISTDFKETMKKNMDSMLPNIMKTGTKVDEDLFKKKEDNQLFGLNIANIANLANKLVNMDGKQSLMKSLHEIELDNIVSFSIFPSLISIFCLNQSNDLEPKILHIVTRLYNQRYEFADLSNKMLLLFDDTNINIFKKSKKKMLVLAKCVDESETWVQNLEQPQHLKTLELVQEHFEFFTQLLFKNSYLNEAQDVEKGQDGQVDSIRQDMMRHLKVDKLGVDLIKDSVFMVEQEQDPNLLDKLKRMFKVCLTFLKYFCMNNLANQNVMSQHIIALISNLNTDLGQVELLCEIYRDNKAICYDRSQEVIDDFVRLIIANGRRVRYLEFFLVIIQIKTEYISQNQKAVLNLFIDPRFKTQLFYMHPFKIDVDEHPIFDFCQKNSDNPNYQDEPYNYHAKFIEVCAQCTIGKEGLLSSENKLKAQITFKYIMELLLQKDGFSEEIEAPFEDGQEDQFQEKTHKQRMQIKSGLSIQGQVDLQVDGITILKPSLLDLLFYTYLESEKISEEIFQCFDMIIQFVAMEKERIKQSKSFIPAYHDYFFSNVMLVLNGFIKVFNRELGQQQLQVGSKLSKQSQDFEFQLEEMRNVLTPIFLEKFKRSSRQDVLLDLFLTEAIMKEDLNKQNQADIQQKMDMEQLNRSRQPSQRKIPKRQQTIQTSKRELSTDQIWKELWNIFLKEFLNSTQLSDAINKEQMAFAQAISKVEEIFTKDKIIHQQINKEIIFQRLIAFLEKSSASSDNISTFKLILNVLRNFIQIEDESEFTDDMDESEKKTILARQKRDNQNFLNSNNAMQMILTLLSDYSDPINSQKIFNDLIQFAIDLLDGGNQDIQKSIWNYFQNFTESEILFMRLHNEFQQAIKNMSKPDESLPLPAFQVQTDLIGNILRLLQLFAEGHYTELQEYMHNQSFNHHSYDLIQDFIELLQAYMTALEPDYFQNMVQNFDTITEYIQGPCRINQQALISANFLDLANTLLKIDEVLLEINAEIYSDTQYVPEEDEQEAYGVQPKHLPRWMTAILKYKCSITLISLLEDRDTSDIVFKMQKSISPDVLKNNISNIFYLFQLDYNQEYKLEIFNHFAIEPETKEQELRASFIIETGFNFFFILQLYQKLKAQTQQARRNEEEQEEDFAKQFMDSPFYKIFLLVQNIMKSIQDSALQVAMMAIRTGKVTPKEKRERFLQTKEKIYPQASKFFASKTAKIEIMLESKNVEETYFYILPYCQLDDDAKKNFNESANRVSNKAKVTSLVESSEEIIKTMKLNYKIQLYLNQIQTIKVIIENIDLLRDIEFLLALVINIFIFLFYKKTQNPNSQNSDLTDEQNWSDEDNFEYRDLINSLGIVSIVLSILIVAFFLSRNAPLLLEKAWSGVGQEKLNPIAYLIRLLKTVYYFLSDFFALYYIMYGAAAVLGRFVHVFFYSFHLFEVMLRFPLLLNVVKSVWNPRKMILYTGLLLLIFMFAFTVLAYRIFYDSYKQGFCDSMWICFLSTLDSAFKYDSGIGGFLNPPYDVYATDEVLLLIRFLFDNFFNILVLIIMLNIVSGIIIDTFGELREKLQEYTSDLENQCFICGYDKETIEKESINLQNFSDHIKKEHYQWYYLFYIAYLREKDPTEYTGIESYVADKLEASDITWFPLNKALCLKKDFGNEEDNSIAKPLESIKENAQELKNALIEIQNEIDEED